MKSNSNNFLIRISGLKKLIVCFLAAVIVYIALIILDIDLKERIILGWDSFCLAMIILSWMLFFQTNEDDLCDVVEKQDDGLKAIFIIVLVAAFFSVFGTLLLLTNLDTGSSNKILYTLVSLSPIVCSWVLLHTTFTIRYAHLYHDHNKLNTGSNVGGIEFPDIAEPDYLDFAYFSFVIGMTFQVSDVVVKSKVIRRFVLFHSIVSFVFNTIIVALTINGVAGLKK